MQSAGPVVYIIDDDDIILWMFQEFLQGIGAEIRPFSSARAFTTASFSATCAGGSPQVR